MTALYLLGNLAFGFGLSFFLLIPGFEWLMHRHTMHTDHPRFKLFHDLFDNHHRTHHRIFDHKKRYTMTKETLRINPNRLDGLSFNGWFMLGIVGIHAGLYLILLSPWLFWVNWQTLAMIFLGMVLGSGAFGFLQIKYHYWYHAADGFGYRELAKLPILGHYFLFAAAHHRQHHANTSKCLNTLVPTIDIAVTLFQKIFPPKGVRPT